MKERNSRVSKENIKGKVIENQRILKRRDWIKRRQGKERNKGETFTKVSKL